MSGYCEQCGETVCICDEVKKAPVYNHARLVELRRDAVSASYKFAEEYKDAIAHFTIIKVFELGYIQAIRDKEHIA